MSDWTHLPSDSVTLYLACAALTALVMLFNPPAQYTPPRNACCIPCDGAALAAGVGLCRAGAISAQKGKMMSEYAKPVCRGSWSLGTACGKCERCLATRPQPIAEPVAWMYSVHDTVLFDIERTPNNVRIGYTETPLYPASALEAARCEALEQAAKQVEQFERPRMDEGDYVFIREAAAAIRALKENTNG